MKQVKLYDAGGVAIGLVTAVSVVGALIAENIDVDSATVMGGGGLTMGGFLLHAIWRYLNRHEKLQSLQEKVAEAQLASILEETAHRTAERSHWHTILSKLDAQNKAIERMDSGRYTPIPRDPYDPAPR